MALYIHIYVYFVYVYVHLKCVYVYVSASATHTYTYIQEKYIYTGALVEALDLYSVRPKESGPESERLYLSLVSE